VQEQVLLRLLQQLVELQKLMLGELLPMQYFQVLELLM
jgi:hypothetical protein